MSTEPPITEPERAALGAALGGATALPWVVGTRSDHAGGYVLQAGTLWDGVVAACERREDAAYIALAANMAPRLIDEVERLRAAVETCAALVEAEAAKAKHAAETCISEGDVNEHAADLLAGLAREMRARTRRAQ